MLNLFFKQCLIKKKNILHVVHEEEKSDVSRSNLVANETLFNLAFA